MDNFVIIIALLISLGIVALTIFAAVKVFQKMGYKGQEAIIPFYSQYCMAKATMGNGLYFLALFIGIIPKIGGILLLLVEVVFAIRKAKSFKFGGAGIIGFIFIPTIMYIVIAFGEAKYERLPDWDYHKPFD